MTPNNTIKINEEENCQLTLIKMTSAALFLELCPPGEGIYRTVYFKYPP